MDIKINVCYPHRHVKPESETDLVSEADFGAGELSIRARAAKDRWGPHEVGWKFV